VEVLDIDIQLSEEITAAEEELKPAQKFHEFITGSILAADVSRYCFNCKSCLMVIEDEVFFKCFSCNFTMLKTSVALSLSAN